MRLANFGLAKKFVLGLFSCLLMTMTSSESLGTVLLAKNQIKTFRSWLVTIIEDQISRGPNPRWGQRDCAGLLRFAVHEALESHDLSWRKANGFLGKPLPAELVLTTGEKAEFKNWRLANQKSAPFARAITIIQQNADFLGKSPDLVDAGDLLFFDQGDAQHVMIWTGPRIVYHNGAKAKPNDNGLRAVTFANLLNWPDSRWRPTPSNPNFIGFFRLHFLNSKNRILAQGMTQ